MTFTDDSHSWATGSVGGVSNKPLKPSVALMLATDANWILRQDKGSIANYYTTAEVDNAPMMNCGTPGMRLPGVQRWSVQESLDTVTHTATLEMMNALPVSQIETTLQSSLQGTKLHGTSVKTHWWRDPSDGIQKGASENDAKALGQLYRNFEQSVVYREFYPETITVADASQFPQPEVPVCERNETAYWPKDDANGSLNAVGAYFIQVGNEVMRVTRKSGNTFEIPAGGRAVNNVLESHSAGETVKLLGFGPFTGEWTAYGYLTQNELRPQASLLRPGQCVVAYEGYGNFNDGKMIKQPWTPTSNRFYEFTGYWFVKGQELTLAEDGVPRVTFEMVSCGNILEQTKISTDSVRMLGPNDSKQKASWAKNAFDKANHTRNITGDWVDYTSWNPAHPNSVPLSIKTLYAQHKAFFDHMTSTQFGKECEYCQEEYRRYTKDKKPGADPVGEARAVGKHVYTESIRVFDDAVNAYRSAGPLVTYGRLMIELAKITWEMPLLGSPVGTNEPSGSSTRWSKSPEQLWDNMAQFKGTGLCWASALSFKVDKFEKELNYPSDRDAKGYRQGLKDGVYDGPRWIDQLNVAENITAELAIEPLSAPFESTYEKQPWYQPVLDLADINRMTFLFSRQGFPIFAPRGMNLRGISHMPEYTGRDDNPNAAISAQNFPRPGGNEGVWHLDWGRSISNYNYNFRPEGALTKVYVTGTDAFGNPFTVAASGTGIDINGQLVWYSSVIGHREALQYTGGVQQTDTMSLDNLVLGLDWATSPASYSLKLYRSGEGIVEIARLPQLPKLEAGVFLKYSKKENKSERVKGVQKVYNFLRLRSYINAAQYKNTFIKLLTEDGIFGRETEEAVKQMQRWIKSLQPYELSSEGEKWQKTVVKPADGIWSRSENKVIEDWLQQNDERIKTDVWWYALGGYSWEYYVGAVTGLAIPQKKVEGASSNKQDKENQQWTTDNVALRIRIRNWQQTFVKQALNFGNQAVEESINKATVRTIQSVVADPRICLGDVIFANVPGHINQVNDQGELEVNPNKQLPGGTYITQISRTLDLSAGSYTASYSGYRYKITGALDAQNKLKRNYFAYD